MYIDRHIKHQSSLSDINGTLVFLTVSQNTKLLNFMKMHPVGAEMLHVDERADRQTDGRSEMTKLIVTSRNFANTPKSVTTLD
jgi:hypothetical protein